MRTSTLGNVTVWPVLTAAWGTYCFFWGATVEANPQGLSVAAGSAVALNQGSVLTINVSDRAVLNWQSFNLAPGEKTVFNQPSSASVVWNQILDSHPSSIFGSIQANGIVVLANQQGFWFGPDSVVKTAGFVASTAPAPPAGFFSGGPWNAAGTVPSASIINYGQIQVSSGGSLFLVAEKIENHGILTAPDGTLGLYAGKEVLVSERPDGRGFSAKVTLPTGSVDNFGKLVADAGMIALYAQVVNQGGTAHADSTAQGSGGIDIFASDLVQLAPGSETSARGTGPAPSDAGSVTIKSTGQIAVDATASVSVAGGPSGGNGGRLEISAPILPSLALQLDGKATTGYQSGQLSLDPANIYIDDSASGSLGSGSVKVTDPPGTLSIPTSAFANFSAIHLQASTLIDIRSPWTLPDQTTGGAILTLESGGDILFGASGSITAGAGWQVHLSAGAQFTGAGGVVVGKGSIKGESPANASFSIATQDGSLSLVAGSAVNLAGGQLSSTSGDISVRALGTSISATQLGISSTSGNVSLDAYKDLSLGASQISSGGGKLALIAETGNITGSGFSATSLGGDISLSAGLGLNLASGSIQTSGAGAVTVSANNGSINSSSFGISTEQGDIDLFASNAINFAKNSSGFARTTKGGNILANAVAGAITTGSEQAGYQFFKSGKDSPLAYNVDPALGGFSTAAGGNVVLKAGTDVTSFLPNLQNTAGDAGTGAFGPQPGNVSITAGGSVYGHYVVANGAGIISAAKSAGTPQSQLALSLINGSWSVNATDIALQEVRNPNGTFNNNGSAATSSYFHLFDYSPNAQVTLIATDSIDLVGGALPRNKSDSVSIIFPPSLTMNAGTGGIILGNPIGGTPANVILYPAPRGQLEINVPYDSLASVQGGIFAYGFSGSSLTVSDSGSTRYVSTASFGPTEHAITPVHLNDPTPAEVNVAGSIQNLTLTFAKPALVTVGGNLVSSSVSFQNIHASDVSRLDVAGNITNPANITYATLGANDPEPDFNQLLISCPYLGANLSYDSNTRRVVLEGKLDSTQRDQLKSFMVETFDSNGNVILDNNGRPVCLPYLLLSDTVIDSLFNQSQSITPVVQLGYQVNGPGNLFITAHNIDLGSSGGIGSLGAGGNNRLAGTTPMGANIHVQASGDLTMFASAITSVAGGTVTVDAGGAISVGADFALPATTAPRGIYSTAGGDVTVTATKDILVNGSRIASYDGGLVTVESRTGKIDAGTGGLGLQVVTQYKVDPVTGAIVSKTDYIPGSGILATTFSTGTSTVGNISVSTPQGDVDARTGGILQAAFNGTSEKKATVDVTAGTRDPHDPKHILYKGNIDATGSGVIGGNVNLDATGDINGVVFASVNANVTTPQGNINVTLIAGGTANVSGASVGGTIIGIGSINVSAGTLNANLESQNVSGGGNNAGTTGAQAGTAAAATGTAAAASEGTKTGSSTAEDDTKRKKDLPKTNRPLIAQTKPRVTVILPGKLN